jgi:cell division protein FtsQ
MRFLTARAERSAKPAAPARPRRLRRWPRRTILAAGAGLLLLVLTATGWWLARSGLVAAATAATQQRFLALTAGLGLTVADVRVEGRERTSREAILEALGAARGTPILAVDPAEAKRRLEALPWVHSAAVERRLPDTIYIRLVERRPLAYWQRQGKLVLVDRDGVILPGERVEGLGNLIVLVGADAPEAGAALLDLLAGERALAPRVVAAIRVGGRRWNLHFDGNIDVALPEEDAAAAWHRLGELERSDGILERAIDLIDLRLPDRLVVRNASPVDAAKPPPKKDRPAGKTS